MSKVAAFIVGSLLLVGCYKSDVKDPDADVAVSGQLLHDDGSPVIGKRVSLLYSEHAFLNIMGAEFSQHSTTNERGVYSFQLKGSALNYEGGGIRGFQLLSSEADAAGFRTGPSISASFVINEERLPVDLFLWEPHAEIKDGVARWDPLTPKQGRGSGYFLSFEAEAVPPSTVLPFREIWGIESNNPSALFDPRILEDTRGQFAVYAERTREVQETKVHMRYQSGNIPYEGTAGVPFSRGKACYIQSGSSEQPLNPCPVTDGRLYQQELPVPKQRTPEEVSPGTDLTPPFVVLDLGSVIHVELVVLRNCECRIETSLDGSKWTSLTKNAKGAIKPKMPIVAQFVRVPVDDPVKLNELSVWGTP